MDSLFLSRTFQSLFESCRSLPVLPLSPFGRDTGRGSTRSIFTTFCPPLICHLQQHSPSLSAVITPSDGLRRSSSYFSSTIRALIKMHTNGNIYKTVKLKCTTYAEDQRQNRRCHYYAYLYIYILHKIYMLYIS